MKHLHLCALSLLTPLGATPDMLKAAMDAGISSYQECDLLGDDEPTIRFSPIPSGALKIRTPDQLPGMSPPQIRLLKFATFALVDISTRLPRTSIPLFLAGPEPYYPQIGINHTFIKHLVTSTGVNLDFGNSRYIATGRSGVLTAIDTAFKFLKASNAPYALIGGADSFYDLRTIGILAEKGRLAGSDSFDGFVPGEAAAFLLLASPDAPEAANRGPLLKLHQPAIAHEPGHLLGNAPYTAEVLARVMSEATATVETPINRLYTSENGEMHYTKEVSVAMLRNQHKLCSNNKIIRTAEYMGDLGAASAAVAIALASVEPYTTTLICASSDGGPRGAICLTT